MTYKISYFSSNLKYLRLKNNIDQLELAHKLGRKSASTISEWESGKYTPKQETTQQIAAIFKVSLDDLVAGDLTKYPLSDKEESLQDISYISEHLDSELKQKWIELGQELLNKQDKK